MKSALDIDMKIEEIKREFERDEKEAGMEKLIHLSYDILADGGRGHEERIARKVVDPETEKALRRLFVL